MRARQTLFSYLGLEKLEQFRNEYQVILPRCVLLVDEFQQMFLEATSREANHISEILTSITKLGRATGYHLIFASQEMTSTLGSSTFANFKVRFALRCNSDVSSSFLGNPAASRIGNRERGIVIENSVDGSEENNRTYKVPFIDEDGGESDYFSSFLHEQYSIATQCGYTSVHKYYQEDFIKPFEDLKMLLSDDRVYKRKKEILNNEPNCIDILTLGDSVVFNFKKYDYETVYLESGSKKNIGIFSPTVRDLTYICRMLAANFKNSTKASFYKHIAIIKNDLFERNYDIVADLNIPSHYYLRTDSAFDNKVLEMIRKRKSGLSLVQNYDQYDSLEKFVKATIIHRANLILPKERQKNLETPDENGQNWYDKISYYFHNTQPSDILEIIKKIQTENNKLSDAWFTELKLLYDVKCLGKQYSELYSPFICWILGTELLDSLPRDAERLFADAASYNVLFIFAGSADSRYFTDIYNSCDYLFIAGNQQRIYDRWDIPYTQKAEDSIVIDFKIRSANSQRSFKKFHLKTEDRELPRLDFDDLFSEKQ